MKKLHTYLIENIVHSSNHLVLEGGASGHMKYPYDYVEFTLRDLEELISNLFSGQISDVTEKVDGMNIQASKNEAGEVVFIRNKSDLNSARGGMMMTDIISKWSDKPHVLETFTKSAETISKIFEKIPISFFNSNGQRRYVNCECVIAGKTNIMPYISEQVDFHDIWVYEHNGKEWVKVDVTKDGLDRINKAAQGTKGQITPQLIIDVTENSKALSKKYISELKKLFKVVDLEEDNSIEEYKTAKFNEYCKANVKWILNSVEGADILYRRWFNGDKSVNIKYIRQFYPDHIDELNDLDKRGYRHIIITCMSDLDDLFIRLGNDIIKLCRGIINSNRESDVIKQLMIDLKDTVDYIRKNGSIEANDKLDMQLKRLNSIGEKNIAAVEGIVFNYKGKTMKLTSGFAPLNQILGAIKFSKI